MRTMTETTELSQREVRGFGLGDLKSTFLSFIAVALVLPTAGAESVRKPAAHPSCYSVRDYGAKGDGTTKDTAALQKAIDACHADGGGVVLLPAGRYLSGTIYLKSNVEFHLTAGARLVASPDRADYNPDDAFPENRAIPHERVSGAHLIICYRQENVALTGQGTIDGNSEAFYKPARPGTYATFRYKNGTRGNDVDWRPSQLIHFCISRGISVRDVTIVDAPFSNLFLQACRDVQVRGVRISQPPASHSDGIVVDFSRNVTISDCLISTGDDCICIFTRFRTGLGEEAVACENVTVNNCILRTPCNAFRVGVGDGDIRNCTINNIIIPEARTAISIVARYSERVEHGASIERVLFSNMIADVCTPIVMDVGPGATRPAAIRDVSFSRLRFRAWAGSQLVGSPEVPLERIDIADVDWEIRGGTDNLSFLEQLPKRVSRLGYHGMNGTPALPCVLYATHAEDLVLERIRVRWGEISKVWRDGLLIENSRDVMLSDLHLRQPREPDGAAVRSRANAGVTVRHCRAARGTGTFLLAEQSPPQTSIRYSGNDMSDARVPAKCDAPLQPFRDFQSMDPRP